MNTGTNRCSETFCDKNLHLSEASYAVLFSTGQQTSTCFISDDRSNFLPAAVICLVREESMCAGKNRT
jgi:hypothetical protein